MSGPQTRRLSKGLLGLAVTVGALLLVADAWLAFFTIVPLEFTPPRAR